MAAATTENQSHGVTSTTSDHVATNAAPDVCFTPDKSAVIPHDNTVNTALATEHTTPKTQIAEGPVVRQGDAIGPTSTSGDGGACGKGVASGTCQQEARVASGSPNVTAEGAPVARKADPGTSNHANTAMVVKGGDPAASEADLEAQKKLLCSLVIQQKPPVAWDSVTHIICAHKRYPGADNTLQVASTCSMKLLGKRKNGKVADQPPNCAEKEGTHTEWEVSRHVKAKLDKGPIKLNGDEKELEEAWFQTAATPTMKNSKDPPKTGRDAKGQFDGTDKVTYLSAAGDAYGLYKSFKEFWECATGEPIEVEIVATACSGQTTFKVKAYQGEEVKIKFDDKLFNKIRAVCDVINAIVKGAKYVASVGGGHVDAVLHLLEQGFFMEASVNWAELKEDSEVVHKLKHMCDIEWSATVGVEGSFAGSAMVTPKSVGGTGRINTDTGKAKGSDNKPEGAFGPEGKLAGVGSAGGKGLANLAKFGIKFGMEIVAFVNAFLPSVGTIAAKAINFLGASATAGIDIKFEAGIQLGLSKKAGEGVNITGGISTLFDVYINVKLSWGSSLEISGGCAVTAEPHFTVEFPPNKHWLTDMSMNLEKGVVSFGFRGVFHVDIGWWVLKLKEDKQIDYIPDWAKCEYGPYQMKPFGTLE